MENDYKDPKDLRDISYERLQKEGNQHGLQFNEWSALFDIESAIRRVNNSDVPEYDKISELLKWCIFSNRYLLMDRESLTNYKLFTKEEVLRMINDAYYAGYNDCAYCKEEGTTQDQTASKYMEKVQTI